MKLADYLVNLRLATTASWCRGEKSLFLFLMRHLMPSLGSSAQKMIFLLYGPNFLLFPKEEKEKSCNNLKVGERSWVRGLVIRREGISTQRICSTLQCSLLFFIPSLLWWRFL